VSCFFRQHAINFFTEPLILAHDRDAVEIHLYSDVANPDDVTRRLAAAVDGWHSIVGQPDDVVAAGIRRDGMDILVDLNGHMGAHRLLMFARRPAPVQVTYLGYQATTGMRAVDYRLTDAFADPLTKTDAWHAETLVRLPNSFFCYRPPSECPPVTPSQAQSHGFVTFGSFNAFAKVTPAVIAAWSEILRMVPDSRIHILIPPADSLAIKVNNLFHAEGVTADRITLVRRSPQREYLAAIQAVDIALDTFPFNGHTTTCDALWMGVPVVALCGASYVQRYGSSALKSLGLDDLLSDNVNDYVATAVRWTNDLETLVELRNSLRVRMTKSNLLDARQFAAHVEHACREMWQTWCRRSAQ
jgi:predicted O-linked N-acetylglucosamine transferase (SPINDLY family)